MVAEWRAAAERDRGLENCFYHLGTESEGEAERRKGEQRQTERPNWWPEPEGPGVHMEGNTLPCALLHTLLF